VILSSVPYSGAAVFKSWPENGCPKRFFVIFVSVFTKEGYSISNMPRPLRSVSFPTKYFLIKYYTEWTARIRSATEAEDFPSNLWVQNGSGAHPASYTMDTGGPFPWGKLRPERDADCSPPSSAEVKKE
jgi:hypothetical protein